MKPSFTSSIVRRLTGWYGATLFISIFICTGVLYLSLIKILDAEDAAVLRDRIDAISLILQSSPDPVGRLRQRIENEWAVRHSEPIFVKIVDLSKTAVAGAPAPDNVIAASPILPPVLESTVFPQTASKPVRFRDSERTYLSMMKILDVPSGGLPRVAVYVALDLNFERNILTQFRTSFISILAICLIFVLFLGFRFARFSFSPVKDIIDTTSRITGTAMRERVTTAKLPVELLKLATTINKMLDRLENSFERLSRFTSDIAHELRTPINNIRGEAEVTLATERTASDYRETLSSILEEFTRISAMIDSLLFLAKTENPDLKLKAEKFNLKNEVVNILDFYEASASEENIRIDYNIADDLELETEKTLFQRAVSNVISNSINYTSAGGSIQVAAEKAGDEIRLKITDTGKGMSEEELARVFDRFYRGDPSRSATKLGGFGLGLTIVKSIMDLFGGSVKIQSAPTRGTTVLLEFPREIARPDVTPR